MIDRITALIQAGFSAIGKAAGLLVAWLLWPFMAAPWLVQRGRNWLIKGRSPSSSSCLAGFYGTLSGRPRSGQISIRTMSPVTSFRTYRPPGRNCQP